MAEEFCLEGRVWLSGWAAPVPEFVTEEFMEGAVGAMGETELFTPPTGFGLILMPVSLEADAEGVQVWESAGRLA